MNFFVEKISKIKTENKPFERSCNCREGGDNSSSNNGERGHSQTHTHTHVRALLTCTGAPTESVWNANADSLFRLKSIEINFHQKATKRQREQLQQASRYGRERAKINQPAKHRHTKIKKKT